MASNTSSTEELESEAPETDDKPTSADATPQDWSQRLGHYVVSLRNKGRTKVLHQVGKCHRIPGRDYQQFSMLGTDAPEENAYTSTCKDCWKHGLRSGQGGPEDSDSSDSSASWSTPSGESSAAE